MQTSHRAASHFAADDLSLRHEAESDRKDGEHPDDWREDRLTLAIRVIEALGLRPVGSTSALH